MPQQRTGTLQPPLDCLRCASRNFCSRLQVIAAPIELELSPGPPKIGDARRRAPSARECSATSTSRCPTTRAAARTRRATVQLHGVGRGLVQLRAVADLLREGARGGAERRLARRAAARLPHLLGAQRLVRRSSRSAPTCRRTGRATTTPRSGASSTTRCAPRAPPRRTSRRRRHSAHCSDGRHPTSPQVRAAAAASLKYPDVQSPLRTSDAFPHKTSAPT